MFGEATVRPAPGVQQRLFGSGRPTIPVFCLANRQ